MKHRIKTHTCLLLIGIATFSQQSLAQNALNGSNGWAAQEGNFDISSPNASSLGTFGQLPVNLSTGQLGTTIPIYDFKAYDIKVPISLSYNNRGFKPNDHPSWAGEGWTLNAGGAITRIKHGEADEILIPCHTCTPQANSASSALLGYIQNGLLRQAYLQNYNDQLYNAAQNPFNQSIATQSEHGFSDANMPSSTVYLLDTQPDEFAFNFLGKTGKFVFKNAWDQGNVGWAVLTTSGEEFDISVSYATELDFRGDGSIILPRYINEFFLKSRDGYTYEFGGNYSDGDVELYLGAPNGKYGTTPREKGNNIYASSWYLTKITSPSGVVVDFAYQNDGYAAAMYPAVDIAQFINDPNNLTVNNSKKTNYNTYSIAVNTTSYLTSITCRGQSVSFGRGPTNYINLASPAANWQDISVSEQLDPDYVKTIGDNVPNQGFPSGHIMQSYQDMYNICTYDGNLLATFKQNWQKLTDIRVYEGTNLVTGFDFDYYLWLTNKPQVVNYTHDIHESKTGRLELKQIKQRTYTTPIEYKTLYSFEYSGSSNPQPVTDAVNYGVRSIDHEGFYSGVASSTDFFNYVTDTFNISLAGNSIGIGNSNGIASINSNYYLSREPNFDQAYNGLLTKINYPTGGYTTISYEQNTYSKYQMLNTSVPQIQVVSEPTVMYAPGMRVKQTTDYDYMSSISAVTKNYSYVQNFSVPAPTIPTTTSGVLNSGKPVYATGGITNYYAYNNPPDGYPSYLDPLRFGRLMSQGTFPDVFPGTGLLYSRVTEVNHDNSYTINYFSNSDQGAPYIDYVETLPTYTGSTPNNALIPNGLPFTTFKSMDAERGHLLKQEYYTNTNILKRKVEYAYNDDPNRFSASTTTYSVPINSNTLTEVHPAVNALVNAGGMIPLPILGLSKYNVKSYLTGYYTYYPYLKSKTQTEYPGNFVESTTHYYDDYWNEIKTASLKSDLTTVSTYTKYCTPDNYSFNTSSTDPNIQSITSLLTDKLYGLPIESISTVTYPSAPENITVGTLITYSNVNHLLKSVSPMEITIPQPMQNFNWASNSGSSFTYNSGYRFGAKSVTLYSPYNIFYPMGMQEDGINTCLLKSYDARYTTATVKNAACSNIAFTSFEGSSSNGTDGGNWHPINGTLSTSVSFTGNNSYYINSGNISSSTLTQGNYAVRFWSIYGTQSVNSITPTLLTTSQNGWSLYEVILNNVTGVNVSGSGYIDDLRLYPIDATMETATYSPQIGVTSHSDANNMPTFFIYDGFGRLTQTTDVDGNLLKVTDYGLQVTE